MVTISTGKGQYQNGRGRYGGGDAHLNADFLHLMQMSVKCFYGFFWGGEVFVQIHCSFFFIGLFTVFFFESYEFFIYLDISLLSEAFFANTFSHSVGAFLFY